MNDNYKYYILIIATICITTISLMLYSDIELNKQIKEKKESISKLKENHAELYNDIESKISKFNNEYNLKEFEKSNNVKISLETSNDVEIFGNKLANYISNVNGRLLSINKKQIEEGGYIDSIMFLTNPSSGILPRHVSGTKKDKVTFIIEVPQDAPYNEYLQDILDDDFRQIQKDIQNGKEIK